MTDEPTNNTEHQGTGSSGMTEQTAQNLISTMERMIDATNELARAMPVAKEVVEQMKELGDDLETVSGELEELGNQIASSSVNGSRG